MFDTDWKSAWEEERIAHEATKELFKNTQDAHAEMHNDLILILNEIKNLHPKYIGYDRDSIIHILLATENELREKWTTV